MPTRARLPRRPGLALIAAAILLAIGAPAATAADRGVRIADFAYSPRTITITVGDRVTWTNQDAVEHTATATSGAFDTGLLGNGVSATFRFTTAGTYRYLCTPHPTMTGTIVVRAAGGVAPPPTDALDGSAGDGGPPWNLALAVAVGLALLVLLIAPGPRRRAEVGSSAEVPPRGE